MIKVHKEKARVFDKSKYPYLGIFEDGEVILFTGDSVGVSLGGGFAQRLGKLMTIWDERRAKRFNGSITLTQED